MGFGFRESSYALGMDKSDENSTEAEQPKPLCRFVVRINPNPNVQLVRTLTKACLGRLR